MEVVSVIVPVYNAEKYLRQCIESILNSTYRALEIILINDGSTDSSGAICEEYTKKDSRILVIHQKNKGVAAARNKGLDNATGKYVSFVDSDDAVKEKFFEKMVCTLEESKSDWSASGYFVDEEIMGTDIHEEKKLCVDIVEGVSDEIGVITVAPEFRNITWTNGYVWNKLYIREKINFRFSENILMGEDLEFNIKYCHVANRMSIFNKGLYFYRQSETSIMGSYRNNKGIKKGIESSKVWIDITQHADKYEDSLKSYLQGRTAYMLHGALWRVYSGKAEEKEKDFVKQARYYIKRYWKNTWKDKETYNLKIRGIVCLSVFGFPIWRALARII